MATVQKITSNLWFDNQAEEAAKFYTSIFKKSGIGRITYYGKEGMEVHKRPVGSVMTVEFSLADQNFVALNGGPVFKFNEAISFVINCDSQEEIDYYWDQLSKGGDPNAQMCGWLKDKYGLSWQVVPTILPELLSDRDESKSQSVMRAVMKMKKLDIEVLREAYESKVLVN